MKQINCTRSNLFLSLSNKLFIIVFTFSPDLVNNSRFQSTKNYMCSRNINLSNCRALAKKLEIVQFSRGFFSIPGGGLGVRTVTSAVRLKPIEKLQNGEGKLLQRRWRTHENEHDFICRRQVLLFHGIDLSALHYHFPQAKGTRWLKKGFKFLAAH